MCSKLVQIWVNISKTFCIKILRSKDDDFFVAEENFLSRDYFTVDLCGQSSTNA